MKNVYEYRTKVGISSTPAFEEKGLATHAVNTGTKCNNDCCYCYLASLPIRMHKSFKKRSGLILQCLGFNTSSNKVEITTEQWPLTN